MPPNASEIIERINAQSQGRFRLPATLKGVEFSFSAGHKRALLFVALAAVAIASALFLSAQARPDARVISTEPTPSNSVSAPLSTLVVDVQGEVVNPGIYQLPLGARVADAIKSAGGVRKGQSTSSVNLARFLEDGEQVFVAGTNPETGTGAAVGGDFPANASMGGKLNINRASTSELDGLPGVGPVLAKRIVEYRAANGSFTSIDELQKVAGIGPSKFSELRKFVTT